MSSPRTSPEKRIYPRAEDAIRTVPLHVLETQPNQASDAATKVAAPPRLTYRHGPLLVTPEVFTVFWGTEWESPQATALMTHLNQFFDFVLTSQLIDELAEYSVPAYQIRHGRRTGTVVLSTPALQHSVSDTAIQHMLQHEISAKTDLPTPTPNTLYFIYLPPGIKVVQGGSASCGGFCGYHNDVSGQIFYAVVPYPGCAGCSGGLPVFDALTSTSSHELCEAITDPIPGKGWYDDVHGEIGDICAWKTKTLGAYTVQLEWSNRANQCI